MNVSSSFIVIVVGLCLLAAGLYGKGPVFTNALNQLLTPNQKPAPSPNPNVGASATSVSSGTTLAISPSPVILGGSDV